MYSFQHNIQDWFVDTRPIKWLCQCHWNNRKGPRWNRRLLNHQKENGNCWRVFHVQKTFLTLSRFQISVIWLFDCFTLENISEHVEDHHVLSWLWNIDAACHSGKYKLIIYIKCCQTLTSLHDVHSSVLCLDCWKMCRCYVIFRTKIHPGSNLMIFHPSIPYCLVVQSF